MAFLTSTYIVVVPVFAVLAFGGVVLKLTTTRLATEDCTWVPLGHVVEHAASHNDVADTSGAPSALHGGREAAVAVCLSFCTRQNTLV